ncbi:hypothetical protein GKZ89_15705 [Bacillus mangrovi]|uniref:Lipoprotein n=1 Tax=Metabacillus mangrovi TaxID=1491830 RepID=A0A7X2S7T7_9BACI|nr:hypothetical protein [Metabacillus mangrovi]MTH54848.1 hypothetical protein [Metabacillus mangrovi]
MKKSALLLWVSSIFLLSSCSFSSSGTYYIHFPKETSPALSDYIRERNTQGSENLLRKTDGSYIISRRNLNDEKNMDYYSYSERDLTNLYSPILKGDHAFEDINTLMGTFKENLWDPIENPIYNRLPLISIENDNQLNIKTSTASKVLNLQQLSNNKITTQDELVINMISSNKQGFVLEMRIPIKKMVFYLFSFNNFSSSDVINKEEFENGTHSERMKKYVLLFKKDDKQEYVSFLNQIFSVKNNAVFQVRNGDLISMDGMFVYLNGTFEGISEGKQKIQTIKDYAESNDQYHAAFNLDYGAIAKELDLKTSGKPNTSIQYFNKDYVVIKIIYNGIIWGQAGAPTVIVDLQKDKEKPDFYLFGLAS